MRRRIEEDITCIIPMNFHEYELELAGLEKIKKHDEYTYFHSLNVCRISVMLAERMGFSPTMLVDLAWAALLHDLGKIHVPVEILNKEKKFEPEELAIMKSHPVKAISAFVESQDLNLNSLERLCAAFEHHQRYDLKGYPQVSSKLTLHPFSRIVAIADTFDAMTTDRIYQRRMLPDVALKIMSQGYGTIFDPIALQVFVTCMGVYPVGSLVRMNDDRLAVVVKYSERSAIDRPIVKYVTDRDIEVDLMHQEFLHLKILNSEFPEDHGITPESFL